MHNNYKRTFWPQVTTLESWKIVIWFTCWQSIWFVNQTLSILHTFDKFTKSSTHFMCSKSISIELQHLICLICLHCLNQRCMNYRPETIEVESMAWMLNPQKVCLEKLEIHFNRNWWHVFGDYVMFVFLFVEFESDK